MKKGKSQFDALEHDICNLRRDTSNQLSLGLPEDVVSLNQILKLIKAYRLRESVLSGMVES